MPWGGSLAMSSPVHTTPAPPQMAKDPIYQEVCKMAHQIVEARHDAQLKRAVRDLQAADATAQKLLNKARNKAHLDSQGARMAAQALDHKAVRRRGGGGRLLMDNEDGEGEEGEEDGGEEGDGDSTITGSSRGGERRRAALKEEQASMVAAIAQRREEEEEKKRAADPQWAIVKALEALGGRGDDGDSSVARLIETMEKRNERDEKRARERATRDDLLKLDAYMREQNISEEDLPPKLKRKWARLNAESDEE